MAELNLTQVTEKLNELFNADNRQIVFWYDERGEFAGEVESIQLANAKVHIMSENTQFKTKYLLEREDASSNYLVYAPFSKPDIRDNHLEDILLYSKLFAADKLAIILGDLGLPLSMAPCIRKYMKYFGSKERIKKFSDYGLKECSEDDVVLGIMSALCKKNVLSSFEDILTFVLMNTDIERDGFSEENKVLQEFSKYDVLDDFWRLCEEQYGYYIKDSKPNLSSLCITLFVTYLDNMIARGVPDTLKIFATSKQGNTIAILDHMMDSINCSEQFDRISACVAKKINAIGFLSDYDPAHLLECDAFIDVDKVIIRWIIDRLKDYNLNAQLAGYSIEEVCHKRSRTHFGKYTQNTYETLNYAAKVIAAKNFDPKDKMKDLVESYTEHDYEIDYAYRKFYFYYDKLKDNQNLVALRDLVESVYTNKYLNILLPAWSKGLQTLAPFTNLPQQIDFYENNLAHSKERTVVIISDALRYEVGKELYRRAVDNPKCKTKLEAMFSTLPSYTRLGMAALLPHKSIEMTADFNILVDGKSCDNLASRQAILQSYVPKSLCIQYDDIKNLKRQDLRQMVLGAEVIYIYHNQIDAVGDKATTEDEVFEACEKAIGEITSIINKIYADANTYNFIVTADHGFIYKRDKLDESDKVSGISTKNTFANRRFVVGDNAVNEVGVDSLKMGDILNNDDAKVVSYPISSNVFKLPGAGINYVHGGSSPLEMVVPVVYIKMGRAHVETRQVEINLISTIKKITNKVTSIEFMQKEAITDTVIAGNYNIYFVDENNEKITQVHTYLADSRSEEVEPRRFKLRFQFKDIDYPRGYVSYLVIQDFSTGIEKFRKEMPVDMAFGSNFGW